MALFNNRGRNQKITLATADQTEPPEQGDQDTGLTFTPDQTTTILDAVRLDKTATTDDVVAAITALAEYAEKTTEQAPQPVAAASAHQGVTIDANAWKDMQRAIYRGVTADQQQHRLAAEQTVDQAIKLGKASPAQREQWISAYEKDPEDTLVRLNREQEIPRFEIGHGMHLDDDGNPTGWVR